FLSRGQRVTPQKALTTRRHGFRAPVLLEEGRIPVDDDYEDDPSEPIRAPAAPEGKRLKGGRGQSRKTNRDQRRPSRLATGVRSSPRQARRVSRRSRRSSRR